MEALQKELHLKENRISKLQKSNHHLKSRSTILEEKVNDKEEKLKVLANQLLKAKELEIELTTSIESDPDKQEYHTQCETKIENLTKQLHDANGIKTK